MNSLYNLDYEKNYQYGEDFFDGKNVERIYLKKTHSKAENRDYYFLNLYSISPFGDMVCQGYMYFGLNQQSNQAKFIGVYIRPECRNSGYASLLITNWIKLCLDNDIYDLRANKRQRKPFILYLLKKYEFELANRDEYNTSPYVIHICRDLSSNFKYLLFDNEKQKQGFASGKIMSHDSYHIIDSLTDGIEEVDKVILSRPHLLQDENQAYVKSLRYIKKRTENKNG